MSILLEVLLPIPISRTYTYRASEALPRGTFVKVPFGQKEEVGVIWSDDFQDQNTEFNGRLKSISEIIPLPPLPENLCTFVDWIAKYTLSPLGSVLKLAMGERTLFTPPKRKAKEKEISSVGFSESLNATSPSFKLNPEQNSAAQHIKTALEAQKFSVWLLDGVTGSGKTEVYYEALQKVIEEGGQALLMLPEISLSAQGLTRFQKRFGVAPLVWHSELSPKVRRNVWRRIASPEPLVVVGARSSLFLPFQDLRLIVVDEEHESSFKQEEGVFYNARDMSVVRGHIENCPVVLSSATPSLETMANVEADRYKLLHLPNRTGTAQIPQIESLDMRTFAKEMRETSKREGTMAFLSQPLRQAIIETLGRGEQTLLYLNRRGYAPLTLCRSCGFRYCCPNCSAWLVAHKSGSRLACHHCGHHIYTSTSCPQCAEEDTLAACGPGVERIDEEVRRFLPDARICVLSSDTLVSPAKTESLITEITNNEIDIIIGTQVMAKGHHFPNLTLVGAVDADLGLSGGDLRASERTYQVLHQVSGRSGRAEKPGRVLIQTYAPEHPVMQALVSGNRDRFLKEETHARAEAQMPPFGRLAALIVTSPNQALVEDYVRKLGRVIPTVPGIQILGPSPAPLFQLGRRFRWRFLVKARKDVPIHRTLSTWISRAKVPSNVKVHVDMDPYSFL